LLCQARNRKINPKINVVDVVDIIEY
jgi:hypothetical protein